MKKKSKAYWDEVNDFMRFILKKYGFINGASFLDYCERNF